MLYYIIRYQLNNNNNINYYIMPVIILYLLLIKYALINLCDYEWRVCEAKKYDII